MVNIRYKCSCLKLKNKRFPRFLSKIFKHNISLPITVRRCRPKGSMTGKMMRPVEDCTV